MTRLSKLFDNWGTIVEGNLTLYAKSVFHLPRARHTCDWSKYGVNIDGVRLNHLPFADDIVLITGSPEHTSEMLHRLDEKESHYGLVINTSETKVMRYPFSQHSRTFARKSHRKRWR
ncbi:hypothetical protein TELCIR_09824, partial [Teladorsagia circumcincta]